MGGRAWSSAAGNGGTRVSGTADQRALVWRSHYCGLMVLTHTYTRTSLAITHADPYKVCVQCGIWITGVLDKPRGPLTVVPCEHQRGYSDVCPSWGPVDGCRCAKILGQRDHGVPPAPAEGQVL